MSVTMPSKTNSDYPGAKDLNKDLKNGLSSGTFHALLLIDLDMFQLINQKHSRKTGDHILSLVAEFLNGTLLKWYRIGGEEFGLIVHKSNGSFNGESIRTRIPLFIHEKTGIQITVSGGGLYHPGEDFGNDPRMANIIFSTADQLLITAKKQGRDRILWLPDEPVRSIGILNAMIRFYREIARINFSSANKLNPLTGLPESSILTQHLNCVTRQSSRTNHAFALLFLNSDSLKDISRLKGQAAGDRFIIDIARILKDVIRGSDFISHLGADEFAIILEDVNREKALTLADRIKKAVSERTEGTVSIGLYCGVPENIKDAAAETLKKAKRAGKKRAVLSDN